MSSRGKWFGKWVVCIVLTLYSIVTLSRLTVVAYSAMRTIPERVRPHNVIPVTLQKNISPESPPFSPEERKSRLRQLEDRRRECTEVDAVVNNSDTSQPLCDCIPGDLIHQLDVGVRERELSMLSQSPEMNHYRDRYWTPEFCTARFRITIIIPYSGEEDLLKILLHRLHRILRKQSVEYIIFTVEYGKSALFQKGPLLNAGFKHVVKEFNPDCVIFHEVNLVPEDGRNFYQCLNHSVLHLSPSQSHLKYRLPYRALLAGVVAFRPDDFIKVNGYSNRLTGHYMDDDMAVRIRRNNMTITRYLNPITRFKHLTQHGRNMRQLRDKKKTFINRESERDGLNSMDFTVLQNITYANHVNIKFDVKVNEQNLRSREVHLSSVPGIAQLHFPYKYKINEAKAAAGNGNKEANVILPNGNFRSQIRGTASRSKWPDRNSSEGKAPRPLHTLQIFDQNKHS